MSQKHAAYVSFVLSGTICPYIFHNVWIVSKCNSRRDNFSKEAQDRSGSDRHAVRTRRARWELPPASSRYPSSPQAIFSNSLFSSLMQKGRPIFISGLITTATTAEKKAVFWVLKKSQQCVHQKRITVKICTAGDASFRHLLFLDFQFCGSLIASAKESPCLSRHTGLDSVEYQQARLGLEIWCFAECGPQLAFRSGGWQETGAACTQDASWRSVSQRCSLAAWATSYFWATGSKVTHDLSTFNTSQPFRITSSRTADFLLV